MFDITFDGVYFTKVLMRWVTSFITGFLLVFVLSYILLRKTLHRIKNSGKKLLIIGVFILFAMLGGLITLFIADVSMADYFFTRW